MPEYRTTRNRLLPALAVAVCGLLFTLVADCKAGIVCPSAFSFDAQDLERDLAPKQKEPGSSVPSDSPLGPNESDQNRKQSDHLKPGIPTSSSSSSSSSSFPGGSARTIAGMNTISAIMIADDSLLGRLPEDHGLSLPDAPGTDLLRPPRIATTSATSAR